MSAVLPNPLYYLDNFQRVLDWVAQRYDDLLLEEERQFIIGFAALPFVSRALLVRMAMRKGALFRASKLRYAEIGCPRIAAQALTARGWLDQDPVLDLDELFALLTRQEVADAFRFSSRARAYTKQQLLESIRLEFSDARPLRAWCTDSDETVYRVTVTPLFERLRLLFFGNLHQTWSEFVLADLGIYRFEAVELSAASRGFSCRRDVDDYLILHACRERFDNGEALDDIVPDIPSTPHDNPWLEGRRNKLLFKIAQQYERCGELNFALQLYRTCNYPQARLRTIRVLERCEDFVAACRLAELTAAAPESEAELQAVARMLPRLRRKNGQPKQIMPRRATIENIKLQLPRTINDPVTSIEYAVRDHYQDEACVVFYVENTLINSLFGLLCWQAIFAPLPGAFFHPFHHAPADLHSADFQQRRADLFAACFAQLDDGRYRQTILANFRAKSGIQSPFVFWQSIDEDLLMLALDCMPAAHLKKCFERLLGDIASNRSGLPDLIQFWPAERRYRMLEVKGPGDRLQDNQIRWLNYCATHGIPVVVCYVQWLEDEQVSAA